MEKRKKIFIPYHKKDYEIKKQVQAHLVPYEKKGLLKFWCTENILPGQEYAQIIDKEFLDVKIAIPLISIDFINKELDSEEIKKIINNHQRDGLELLSILIRYCAWEEIDWLSSDDIIPKNLEPLNKLDDNEKEKVLTTFAKQLKEKL